MSISADSISGSSISSTAKQPEPNIVFVWLAILLKLVEQKWPDEANPKVFS